MSNLFSRIDTRSTRLFCALVGAWLFSLTVVSPALAEEPGRSLNGHDFLPSEAVDAPFAVSHLSSLTGAGMAFGVKTPFIDVDGETIGTLEGDVAFLALGFGYQHRFGDWFAARARMGGGGRIGTDEQAMLAQGVTGTTVLGLGGIARIVQRKTFIVSGALDFGRTELVGLNAYEFAQRVVDAGGLDPEDNQLMSTGTATTARLSALAGWAPYDWLGIHGYLDGGWVDAPESDTEAMMGFAVAAGVDMKNLDLIPLGLQAVVRNNAFTTGGADLASRVWELGMGFYYTGWDDFSVGLEGTMNQLSRRGEGDDFESMVVTFNLRYWP